MAAGAGAIVLAGGRSQRMGRDKGRLVIGGQTLLARVVARIGQRCSPVVVCAAPGQALPELPPAVLRVDDPDPDAGPLVGVRGGLGALIGRGLDRAFVAGCDAPGLTAAHVAWMLDALGEATPETIAVVPVDPSGRRHPLAAAVRCRPALARADATASGRLQDWLSGPGVLEVPVARLPDPDAVRPCNTASDWRRALGERIVAVEAGHHGAIDRLLRAAFDGADEAELVAALRRAGDMAIERVTLLEGRVAGYVSLPRMRAPASMLALAPLAVASAHRRLGVGEALARAALGAAREAGWSAVVVLGDPDYYARLGFRFGPTATATIATPYPKSHTGLLELRPEALAGVERLIYAAAFG